MALCATTNIDAHGEKFSPKALESLRDTIINCPVIRAFDYGKPPVGKAIDAFIKEAGLYVVVEVNDDAPDGYLVPGFRSLVKHNHVDYRVEGLCIGLVDSPADSYVTKWEEDSDD